MIGFYDDGNNSLCLPCHASWFLNLHLNFIFSYTCIEKTNQDCTSCDKQLFRVLDSEKCKCEIGYYEENNKIQCL